MKINNLVCSNCLNIYRTRLKTRPFDCIKTGHSYGKLEIFIQTQSATETEKHTTSPH